MGINITPDGFGALVDSPFGIVVCEPTRNLLKRERVFRFRVSPLDRFLTMNRITVLPIHYQPATLPLRPAVWF